MLLLGILQSTLLTDRRKSSTDTPREPTFSELHPVDHECRLLFALCITGNWSTLLAHAAPIAKPAAQRMVCLTWRYWPYSAAAHGTRARKARNASSSSFRSANFVLCANSTHTDATRRTHPRCSLTRNRCCSTVLGVGAPHSKKNATIYIAYARQ